MGRYSVSFKCHHSGHCCSEVICLPTPWDVLRIARHTRTHPLAFLEFLRPEEISGVNKSDPTWLKADKERYIMALRRDETLGCFFLDPKSLLCDIYEERPLLCRLYPFKLHESLEGDFAGFTLHKDVGCPRHRDGRVDTAPLYKIYLEDQMHQEDYATLVKSFNDSDASGRKPEQFLDLFMDVVVKEE